jgi:hypothetical protein
MGTGARTGLPDGWTEGGRMTFFYSYACRNSTCSDYKRLTGNALAKWRPLCPRCGYLLVLARIIGVRKHVLVHNTNKEQ